MERLLLWLTDEELVQQYLDNQNTPDKGEPERQELMHRYLKDTDTWVRAALRYHEIPFTVNDDYYNEVLFLIYEKIFASETNVDALRSYDSSRGVLKKWLYRVVINVVRDWIRAQFPCMQLSRPVTVSLDKKVDDEEESQNLYDIIPANLAPYDTERQRQICDALASLPPNHRVVLRFLMIAYDELPEEDVQQIVEDIVKRTGENIEVVEERLRRELKHLRERLRASNKFADGEKLMSELAVLKLKVEYYERRVSDSEQRLLEYFGFSAQYHLSEIRQKPKMLKDIELERQLIKEKYQEHEIDRAEYEKASCLLDYKEYCARLTKREKSWRNKLEEWCSGRYIVTPTQQEIASIYQCPLGTISGWISKGKAELAVRLNIEV